MVRGAPVTATHDRNQYLLTGVLFAGTGVLLLVVAGILALLIPVVFSVFTVGWGLTLLICGVLFPFGTPATGSLTWKLRIYKLQVAVVVVVPLVGTIPLLMSDYWLTGSIIGFSLAALYLAAQIDWEAARTHLETIRNTDDPESVQFIPAEPLLVTRHVVVATGFIVIGWLVPGMIRPIHAGGVFLGAAAITIGIGILCAIPTRGSVERTVMAIRLGVGVSGGWLVVSGVVWATVRGSFVIGGAVTTLGAALIYLAASKTVGSHLEGVVRGVRESDETTWAAGIERYKADLNESNTAERQ